MPAAFTASSGMSAPSFFFPNNPDFQRIDFASFWIKIAFQVFIEVCFSILNICILFVLLIILSPVFFESLCKSRCVFDIFLFALTRLIFYRLLKHFNAAAIDSSLIKSTALIPAIPFSPANLSAPEWLIFH